MPAAQPTLKQQSKLPSSMRYERVQDILENEPAFRTRISPKNHVIESRFGEKIAFSKEAVDITDALHAEGKDAHKVPKGEVLRMAATVLRIITTNGETHAAVSAPSPPTQKPVVKPTAKPATKPVTKPLEQAVPAKKKKAKTKAVTPAKPEPAKPKPEPVAPVKAKVKKAEAKPQQLEPKPARLTKPEPATAPAEEPLPESELPPERQPLRLPDNFDPSKFPHYSVQTSIYGLLLSALSLGEHYEKFPNCEVRHKKLEDVMKDYLATCDSLKLKTT